MRLSIATAALLLMSTAAGAQMQPASPGAATASIRSSMLLRSADDKLLGRIERVVTSKDGLPLAANLIHDGRIVNVPVATITVDGRAAKTSLTRSEVRKLK